MRSLLVVALMGSGCSLLLGSDSSPDASVDGSNADDASTVDALENTTNPDLPYTCDADTIALYHFDDETDLGVEACSGGEFDATGGQASELHAGFLRAVSIGTADATLQTKDSGQILFDDVFAVEAWVRARPAGQDDEVVYIASSNNADASAGGRRFELFLVAEAGNWALRGEVADGNCDDYSIAQGGSIADTDWHHVVLNADARGITAALTLMIDATVVGSQVETFAGVCGNGVPGHIKIGGSARRLDEAYGQVIDELRISKTLRP